MNQPGSQYEQIKRIYDDRRMKHEFELQNRKEKIMNEIPGMREEEQEVISSSMEYGKALIKCGNNPEMKAELMRKYKAKMLDLRLTKSKLLKEAGYPADYLEMTYTCEKCRDTGYCEKDSNSDNGNAEKEKCSCYRQLEVQFLYDSSNLKEWLKTNNFSVMSRDYYSGESLEQFDHAVETCHAFINNFNSDYRNLLIYGTVGTGKSFLTGCITKELIEKGCSVVYYSSIQLFQKISSYYYEKDKYPLNELYKLLFECDLLVIDDLGAELVNDFIRSQLFSILNERFLRQKSIVITSNLGYENLREKYQDRIFSRIYKEFEYIKLSGRDIRMQ